MKVATTAFGWHTVKVTCGTVRVQAKCVGCGNQDMRNVDGMYRQKDWHICRLSRSRMVVEVARLRFAWCRQSLFRIFLSRSMVFGCIDRLGAIVGYISNIVSEIPWICLTISKKFWETNGEIGTWTIHNS